MPKGALRVGISPRSPPGSNTGARSARAKLDGSEVFDVTGIDGPLAPRGEFACAIVRADGRREIIRLLSRLDTSRDVDYFRHGGLLHHVVRHRLTHEAPA